MRENGGQYTHAATWFVIALAELGLADEAWRAFCMLNPVNHALDAAAAERYRVEPYVVAADIYSTGALAGRGGWTWYTGSAGWLYRAATEAILGIRKQRQHHPREPGHPSQWDGFAATLRLAGRSYRIEVSREAGLTAPVVEVDGKADRQAAAFELADGDGEIRGRGQDRCRSGDAN